MDDQIPQKNKSLPMIAGVALVALVASGLYILMQDTVKLPHPTRSPDIAGLIDLWEVKDSKVYMSIASGGKKLVRHTITLEPSTKYIYRKGRKEDTERPESSGALTDISDGIYVNIYLKQNTNIAETIIYADWPL